jgi:hypothetical protein
MVMVKRNWWLNDALFFWVPTIYNWISECFRNPWFNFMAVPNKLKIEEIFCRLISIHKQKCSSRLPNKLKIEGIFCRLISIHKHKCLKNSSGRTWSVTRVVLHITVVKENRTQGHMQRSWTTQIKGVFGWCPAHFTPGLDIPGNLPHTCLVCVLGK